MELIRGIHNILSSHHGCVLTIGNFDGVHRGHAQVIANLVQKAKQLSLPPTVMTFEPQPQELFRGENAPARLSLLRDKIICFIITPEEEPLQPEPDEPDTPEQVPEEAPSNVKLAC